MVKWLAGYSLGLKSPHKASGNVVYVRATLFAGEGQFVEHVLGV